jgi:hypothetical protein
MGYEVQGWMVGVSVYGQHRVFKGSVAWITLQDRMTFEAMLATGNLFQTSTVPAIPTMTPLQD